MKEYLDLFQQKLPIEEIATRLGVQLPTVQVAFQKLKKMGIISGKYFCYQVSQNLEIKVYPVHSRKRKISKKRQEINKVQTHEFVHQNSRKIRVEIPHYVPPIEILPNGRMKNIMPKF